MATAAEVEHAIRTLAKNLAKADPQPDQVPERTILCVVSDLNTAYRADLKNARLQGIAVAEQSDRTDVRITARSDDLIALMEGRLNVGMAFLTGKVRIDAPARDLMLIRRLF